MKNRHSMLVLTSLLFLALVFGLGSAQDQSDDGDIKTAVDMDDPSTELGTVITDPIDEFEGFLFSKLQRIGTKSEGPDYYLEGWDYSETPVIKKTYLWEEDPTLQLFLGTKVLILGVLKDDGIEYQKISQLHPYSTSASETNESMPILTLQVPEVLWVDKMPPLNSTREQEMNLTLVVLWPYRSIWCGASPNPCIYDLWVEHEGESLWRWSDENGCEGEMTAVGLVGYRNYTYTETWRFLSNDIDVEGIYIAGAEFMASRQNVTQEFEVKFAHEQ